MTVIDRPALGAIYQTRSHAAFRRQRLVEGRTIRLMLDARTMARRRIERLLGGLCGPLSYTAQDCERVACELDETAAGLRALAAQVERLPAEWMFDSIEEEAHAEPLER